MLLLGDVSIHCPLVVAEQQGVHVKRNLGVLACIVYRPGEQIATGWGDNALRWLFDRQERFSIPSYFDDATGGLVDVTAQVYPMMIWESAALADILDGGDRNQGAAAIWDAASDNGIHLGMFHGAILVSLGRVVNAGAAYVHRDDVVTPVALLDDTGSHAFMTHEVGHVLGLDHPFLLSDERSYKHGEYADPTCVMSAENFGGRPVTFALTADPASDIAATAKLWTSAGPGVSAATLWRFIPGFPGPQPWARLISPNDPPTPVDLNIPAAPFGTKVVVMPDLFGAGWYTAELRTAAGWDRSLRPASAGDADLVYSPGVVIHHIDDVGVAADGSGWPKDDRVCYEGTIPVPSIGNDDWTNGLFSARVTGPGGSGLIVGRTLPPVESVRLEVISSVPATEAIPGPSTETVLFGPTCGRGTLTTDLRSTSYSITVIAAANGFRQPAFQFSLNDQTIGPWANIVGPTVQNGTAPVAVLLRRPTAYQEHVTESTTVDVAWQLRGNRLTLTVPPGDGRFPLRIGVAVGDATLPTPVAKAAASEAFDLTTSEIALTEESRKAVNQCGRYLGHWRRVAPVGPENPLPPIILPVDWTHLRRESFVAALGSLHLLTQVNARVARDVVPAVAEQLGVPGAELMQAMRRLSPEGEERPARRPRGRQRRADSAG